MNHRDIDKEVVLETGRLFLRNTDYVALYSYCKYTNVPSIKTAESIGMHFVCEYPDETNGISDYKRVSKSE